MDVPSSFSVKDGFPLLDSTLFLWHRYGKKMTVTERRKEEEEQRPAMGLEIRRRFPFKLWLITLLHFSLSFSFPSQHTLDLDTYTSNVEWAKSSGHFSRTFSSSLGHFPWLILFLYPFSLLLFLLHWSRIKPRIPNTEMTRKRLWNETVCSPENSSLTKVRAKCQEEWKVLWQHVTRNSSKIMHRSSRSRNKRSSNYGLFDSLNYYSNWVKADFNIWINHNKSCMSLHPQTPRLFYSILFHLLHLFPSFTK